MKPLSFRSVHLWLVLVLALASACSGNKNLSDASDPEFAKYILSHSMGLVSRSAEIQLSVTPEVAAAINAKGSVEDLFKVEPSVKGQVVWDSTRTLYFRPLVGFKPDQAYTFTFHLGEVVKTSGDYKKFVFGVRTIKPDISVQIDRLRQASPTDKSVMLAEAWLRSADNLTLDEVKQVVQADQDGQKRTIRWEENSEPTLFRFTVEGIVRTNGSSPDLQVKWDGSSANIDVQGHTKMRVPALDEFMLMDIRVFHDPEQYVLIDFSDAVSEKQNLAGLIRLSGAGNLRFVRDGNTVKLIPPTRLNGSYTLEISETLQNFQGKALREAINKPLNFEKMKPAVRFVSNGVILPSSERGLVVPFEAVNLKAVDVVVTKIFENNMLQFLQENELTGDNELRRVGRPISHKTISLNSTSSSNQWETYFLDLNEMIKPDPGAVYRVYIAFRQEHSIFACEDSPDLQKWSDEELEAYWERFEGGYFYDDYEYYDGYWENRENPCHKAYYGLRRTAAQNILASNMGLIAKSADNKTVTAFATDLLTAKPLGGVTVKAYDYQQQLLASATTDGAGMVKLQDLKNPYFVVAERDKERAYLKLYDGNALSLSRFDIQGDALSKGLKGYLYGERGVWRPGDSIFMSFMMAEYTTPLPANHPVVFELRNPMNQLVDRQVQSKNRSNLYTFRTKTSPDDKTGNYTATVAVGGARFDKQVKVETVKPNRLKIDLKFAKTYLASGEGNLVQMQVNWLHGAVGKNLDADVEVVLSDKKTEFAKYKDFLFDDPTKSFYSESQNVFSGKTDDEGKLSFSPDLKVSDAAPGMLNAIFITKAYEPGGNFSIDKISMPYYPYRSYTGLRIEKTDKRYNALVTDEDHTVELITLSPAGAPVTDAQNIELAIYKLDWQYWYNQSASDLAYFIRRENVSPLQKGDVTTSGGKAKWKFRVDKPMWGRFLVRAYNKTTGHSTGEIIYMDWPGWVGRSHGGAGDGATMLSFTTDKTKYNLGESIKLSIPSTAGGKALISIENGSGVVATEWIDTNDGYTEHSMATTKEMTPNVYLNVTLLQPHQQSLNDMPIRMYGVVPISVEVPETHLWPQLSVDEELESEKTFQVKVSEKSGRPMSYTLAVVDEGLLSLTRFATPNPWTHFYAKEALGVRTWDLFDQVIGAYGGQLDRLLAVGGDDEIDKKGGQKANRFEPVVMFLGPFYLDGGSRTHTLKMPRYVGAVRTMVIARHDKAFGSADKESKVTKPIMLQATLPRVLGPGESLKLPVSLFAMRNDVKDVTVTLKTNNLLQIEGENTRTYHFDKPGEGYVDFDLRTLSRVGIGKIELEASSGSHKTQWSVEVDVRTPNTRVNTVWAEAVQPGQSWKVDYLPVGMIGTNKLTIELSKLPPINLAQRIDYLIQYPHGCIEQTTSAAFPQLYLGKLMELTADQRQRTGDNIRAAIQRLAQFQLPSGGFAYWPGSSDASLWGTNYAGHFLVEAQRAGYVVPKTMIDGWIKFQRQHAKKWLNDGQEAQITQAYRLYTMVLASAAEKSAMNRLLEEKKLALTAKWTLAAAYALTGKEQIADGLLKGATTQVAAYQELSGTFGSDLRDRAMMLQAITHLKKNQQAFGLLKEIAEELSADKWLSTQTTAYCLLAVAKYVEKFPSADRIEWQFTAGKTKDQRLSATSAITQALVAGADQSMSFVGKNLSKGVLYARLIAQGVPEAGQETAAANQLRISVSYLNEQGHQLTPTPLAQGTDFYARVTVNNPTTRRLKELALSQVFPSGWEIINARLYDLPNLPSSTTPTYVDYRDDRVYQYFDLGPGQTATFLVQLNASYIGKYYLPAVSAEAMYDASVYAREQGQWVQVVRE